MEGTKTDLWGRRLISLRRAEDCGRRVVVLCQYLNTYLVFIEANTREGCDKLSRTTVSAIGTNDSASFELPADLSLLSRRSTLPVIDTLAVLQAKTAQIQEVIGCPFRLASDCRVSFTPSFSPTVLVAVMARHITLITTLLALSAVAHAQIPAAGGADLAERALFPRKHLAKRDSGWNGVTTLVAAGTTGVSAM
jgi:hypothetical protein